MSLLTLCAQYYGVASLSLRAATIRHIRRSDPGFRVDGFSHDIAEPGARDFMYMDATHPNDIGHTCALH